MDAILGKVGSYWIGKKARRSTPSETISMSYIDINECTSPLVGHSSIMEVYGGGWCHNLCASISKSCPMSMSTSIGGTRWLVNKFKGKMQKPLPELLKEYDLAAGIFPRDATNYEFDVETRKLIVYTPSICEVGYRDSSVLRFSTIVTGFLENGKLANIEGMKTKVMIWAKVTCISANGGKLHFTTGMKKTRSRAVYEVLRDGVSVDKF